MQRAPWRMQRPERRLSGEADSGLEAARRSVRLFALLRSHCPRACASVSVGCGHLMAPCDAPFTSFCLCILCFRCQCHVPYSAIMSCVGRCVPCVRASDVSPPPAGTDEDATRVPVQGAIGMPCARGRTRSRRPPVGVALWICSGDRPSLATGDAGTGGDRNFVYITVNTL